MKNVLKLNRHNEKKEMEFELKYLKSLPLRQRFELMYKKRKEMIQLLEKSGRIRRPFQVIKRT